MKQEQFVTCVAAIGSMTLCLKAERILLAAGIRAHVISLSPGETRRGCAFGVAFPCAVRGNVAALLRGHKLSVSEYLTKEKGFP